MAWTESLKMRLLIKLLGNTRGLCQRICGEVYEKKKLQLVKIRRYNSPGIICLVQKIIEQKLNETS